MRAINYSQIRDLALFRDMDLNNYEQLMHGGYVQNFPPQIEIITEGDPCDFLHIVVEGSVELFSGWNSRESTLAVLYPVSSFILAAAVKDAPNLMSARTMEKSKLILLPAESVRKVFANDHRFAHAIVTELADCYRGVVKSTKNLKLRSSVARLANYLIRQQIRADGASSFELRLEKRRLASLLGMTAENLSRALKSLGAHGIVVEGQRVTITDAAALKTFAKPTPLIDESKT